MHAPPGREAEIESHVRSLVDTVGYENLTYMGRYVKSSVTISTPTRAQTTKRSG